MRPVGLQAKDSGWSFSLDSRSACTCKKGHGDTSFTSLRSFRLKSLMRNQIEMDLSSTQFIYLDLFPFLNS